MCNLSLSLILETGIKRSVTVALAQKYVGSQQVRKSGLCSHQRVPLGIEARAQSAGSNATMAAVIRQILIHLCTVCHYLYGSADDVLTLT